MAAWLYQPVMFDSGHDFDCEGFTPDQCQYYKEHWHNWYVADWTFALPTVAFFMCGIGVFVIGYVLTQTLALCGGSDNLIWRRALAVTRYLSYRGFHIESVGWNSAPVGLLSLGAIGAIYFFCMDLIPSPYYWPGSDEVWGNSPPLGTRSGWLALACMPFLFATASKANWITLVTGVTHEKLQVFHRWIAYAFFILALMHTFPFIVWHIRNHDMVEQFNVSNVFEYWTGIVALLFQAWLTAASWGPIRNLGYEFFKAAHFCAAIVFIVVFFWHCCGTLTSWHYFVATAAVYVPCWSYPWLRTLFEYGIGQRARIFVEENDFISLTIPTESDWRPGQHCFLRFRSFGLHALTSHPFTICSVPSASPQQPSEMTFYIRRQGGLTARLYNIAMKQPGVQLPVLVDGPYGGVDNQKFFTSGRLVVIAGGSGAGWILPFIEQFLQHRSGIRPHSPPNQQAQGTEKDSVESLRETNLQGAQSLHVILATRDIASRTWFYTTLHKLLLKYGLSDLSADLKVEVHLTGKAEHMVGTQPHSKADSAMKTSDSSISTGADLKERHMGDSERSIADEVSETEVRGRPNLPQVIREEARTAAGTGQDVGVFVCGPLTMQNDIRNAVAKENLAILKNPRSGGMYLHLEHFSWA